MVTIDSAVETIAGTVVIWVVVFKMSDIVLVVTRCFGKGYVDTNDIVWVVSLGFTRKCVVDVFTTTGDIGIVFSLVCTIKGSLVPLIVVVFSVLKELTAVINSVVYR